MCLWSFSSNSASQTEKIPWVQLHSLQFYLFCAFISRPGQNAALQKSGCKSSSLMRQQPKEKLPENTCGRYLDRNQTELEIVVIWVTPDHLIMSHTARNKLRVYSMCWKVIRLWLWVLGGAQEQRLWLQRQSCTNLPYEQEWNLDIMYISGTKMHC